MMAQHVLSLPVSNMELDRMTWLECISEAKDTGNLQQITYLLDYYSQLQEHQLEIHVDYENIYYGLRQMGRRYFAEDIIFGIEAALRQSGRIISGTVYADWGRLNRDCHCDIQRIFEEKGIHTRYTLAGRNSADMALANNVRDSLETGLVKADTIVIVSGDGDFLPVAKTIKQRGRRLIILACTRNINGAYQECANEVVLLDNFLKTQSYPI